MPDPRYDQPSDWDEVATLVREAGEYVGASPQLRPRVIERVRRVAGWRQRVYHLAGAALVWLTVTAGLLGIAQGWHRLSPPRGVTSDQLHRLASDRAIALGIHFDWALADVVADWRTRQGGSSRQPGWRTP